LSFSGTMDAFPSAIWFFIGIEVCM
jgi:hypothetical protein